MSMFTRAFQTLPRRLMIGTVLALGIALPNAVSATQAVMLEGATGVANVTRQETRYESAASASYNEIVKVQVTYHNRENENSGKIAQNLRVRIDMPTAAGQTQQIKGTSSADNSNVVSDTVTVNLDRADASLQFIPGSAVWKHNVGSNQNVQYREDKISDAVVNGGLVLENEKPCYNFSATVTVLARVMVPGVQVTKDSQLKSETGKWSTNNTAKPGDTMKYRISYKNTGNTSQNSVVIRDSLPQNMSLVPGSTYLLNAANPKGVKYNSDNVVNGGIVIGNYAPGANAYVTFEAKIADAGKLACGENVFRNIAVARPQGMQDYFNTAVTTVRKDCQTTPANPGYACDSLTLKQEGLKVTANVKYAVKNGASVKTVTYDFGDGSTPLTTDKTTVDHTYARAGNHTVTAKLLVSVNGKTQTVTGENCAKPVGFTTPETPEFTGKSQTPEELPATGTGSVIGLFALVSAGAAGAFHLFQSRRLARQS